MIGSLLLLVSAVAFLIQLAGFLKVFSTIAESEMAPEPSELAEGIAGTMIWSQVSGWALMAGVFLLGLGFAIGWSARRESRDSDAAS